MSVGSKAFSHYLGADQAVWQDHDASVLVESKGALFKDILIDQGMDDQFYDQLNQIYFNVHVKQWGSLSP